MPDLLALDPATAGLCAAVCLVLLLAALALRHRSK